ncbi:NAD-dependent epimerase/dehydratase family protein [Mangrovibacter sp. SLW1]
MKLLVTGSSGFVGSRVVCLAQKRGMHCVCHRGSQPSEGESIANVAHIPLSAAANWQPVLQGVDAVVHCAAKVHQMVGSQNVLAHYREVNVDGTLQLARQAAESGVKRFIFLSSVKVNGELSQPGHPFTAQVTDPPKDPMGSVNMRLNKVYRHCHKRPG